MDVVVSTEEAVMDVVVSTEEIEQIIGGILVTTEDAFKSANAPIPTWLSTSLAAMKPAPPIGFTTGDDGDSPVAVLDAYKKRH